MSNNSSAKKWAILNLLGYIGTLVLNGLANGLPLNGKTTGELSDMYPNLFVPAGLTFSIWGLIYLLLGIFVVYGLIQAFSSNGNARFLDKIGGWFFLSSLFNMSWIMAWHYMLVPVSLGIMLGILISLIGIYQKLKIADSNAPAQEKWLVHAGFSIYLGWITVATIANVTTLLVDIGWDGFGLLPQVWTMGMLGVALLLVAIVTFVRGDAVYGLSVAWAFLGIYLKRSAFGDQNIALVAIIGAGLMLAMMVVQSIRKGVYS